MQLVDRKHEKRTIKKYFVHIWLDDVRLPNIPGESVVWVKDYTSFMAQVKSLGKDISDCIIHFDHDLGGDKDGYDCAKWLIDWCIENNYQAPDYDIQSANPVGRENIESIFKTYHKVF